MEWILIAGALCLSTHHDICIKEGDGDGFAYSLSTPRDKDNYRGKPIKGNYLAPLKGEGERVAKELDEFAPPKHDFVWETPCCKLENNSGTSGGVAPPLQMDSDAWLRVRPYGMTKEEFGAFIEEHARKGAHGAIWNGSK